MQNNFFIRSLLLVCLLISGNRPAQADENELWQRANTFYQQQQYDSAQNIYLRLLAQGVGNFSLYYNLGNTAYRLQQTDSAILFFEKSLLLHPRSEAARQNLALAQSRIVNPLPQAPVFFFTKWWNQLLTALRPNVWAWLSFGAFLICLALIYFHKRKSIRYIGRWLSFSIVCLLLLLCIAYFSHSYSQDSGRAVVMGQHRELLEGPNGKVITEVPRGTVIMIISQEEDYVRLRLPNGNEGWMPKDVLAKI